MIRVYEVQQREPALMVQLLEVWEASVRATHLFLSEQELRRIRGYVPQALAGVAQLLIAEREGRPVAFMGVEDRRLEMLFLRPEERGYGLGRRLLECGIRDCGVEEVTVNEQNPQAVGFSRHMGFEVYRRTDCDEEGGPYQLLYMRRGNSRN